MSKESSKDERELAVYFAFVEKASLPIEYRSARHGCERLGEPDIVVTPPSGEPFGFELTELCAEDLARAMAEATPEAFWTSDPSPRIVEKKLGKTYSVSPVDLLIYWDSRAVTPDDVAISELHCLISAKSAELSFREVWYFGQHETRKLWSAT